MLDDARSIVSATAVPPEYALHSFFMDTSTTFHRSVTEASKPDDRRGKTRTMELDVDLLRELMFSLEARQLSPRATIVLSLAEEAAEFGSSQSQIEISLDALLKLDYIDGAGQDDEVGYWLFRKLTRKGTQFVRATREPRDWERLKGRFEVRRNDSR